MKASTDLAWNGERNREFNVYRPCPCGTCSTGRKGVGYLSASDANGDGFTIWIQDENVFGRLRNALERLGKHSSFSLRPEEKLKRPAK